MDSGNAVSREEFSAQIDPWREPPTVAGYIHDPELGSASVAHSLRSLPRQTKQDVSSSATGYAVLATLGALPLSGALVWELCQLLDVRFPGLADWLYTAVDRLDVLVVLGIAALIVLFALPFIRFYSWMYGVAQTWLAGLWEQPYRAAYMQLAETNLAALICDDQQWAAAFGDFAKSTVFKVIGLGPPKSPEEAVRLAAAFWPYLLRYQAGDTLALAEGILDGYGVFSTAGRSLTLKGEAEQYALRARAAALVDFLLDTPEQLPPYCDPRAIVRRGRPASTIKWRGYDYRLRGRED